MVKPILEYYENSDLALKYFNKIRKMRSVMPDLIEWENGFSDGFRVLDVGFGPAVEFEFLLHKIFNESKSYRLDGIDISASQKQEAEKIFDQKFGLRWRERANLVLSSIQSFQPEAEIYDRIWANASFLHLDKSEMVEQITKYAKALKKNGEIYINFKVGEGETRSDSEGRPFTYYTEESFKKEVLAFVPQLKILKIILSLGDTLGRATTWLNLILVRAD